MNASTFMLEQENSDLRGLVRELKKEIYQLKQENAFLKSQKEQEN